MNAEDSYEMQTLLGAALRSTSSVRDVLAYRVRHANIGAKTQAAMELFWLGDQFLTQRKMREEGPASQTNASIVIGYEPSPTPKDIDDDLVGVVDPELVLSPAPPASDSDPESLLIPNDIFTTMLVDTISAATTFYVTPDMCTVLEHAARGLDDSDFMPDHPRFRSGFAVLAKPIGPAVRGWHDAVGAGLCVVQLRVGAHRLWRARAGRGGGAVR